MPNVAGKDIAPQNIQYFKGNVFTYSYTASGNFPVGSAKAQIQRIGDPDRTALVSFSSGEGLTIEDNVVSLYKIPQDMVMPPGRYEFILEGVINDINQTFRRASYFIVSDDIFAQLSSPSFIVASIVGDTEVLITWDSVTSATQYTLERSVDGLVWSTKYVGANTLYTDTDTAPSTLYYYRVYASAPGYTNSIKVSTNASTFTPGSQLVGTWTYREASGGTLVIGDSVLVGKVMQTVTGSRGTLQVITAGTPTDDQVLFDTGTGTLTFTVALNVDEFISALYSIS